MPERTPFPPARGDEAALFRDFNAELTRTVAGAVGTTSPDVIDDAVAHAWTRFMQYQPDRSRNCVAGCSAWSSMRLGRSRRRNAIMRRTRDGEVSSRAGTSWS